MIPEKHVKQDKGAPQKKTAIVDKVVTQTSEQGWEEKTLAQVHDELYEQAKKGGFVPDPTVRKTLSEISQKKPWLSKMGIELRRNVEKFTAERLAQEKLEREKGARDAETLKDAKPAQGEEDGMEPGHFLEKTNSTGHPDLSQEELELNGKRNAKNNELLNDAKVNQGEEDGSEPGHSLQEIDPMGHPVLSQKELAAKNSSKDKVVFKSANPAAHRDERSLLARIIASLPPQRDIFMEIPDDQAKWNKEEYMRLFGLSADEPRSKEDPEASKSKGGHKNGRELGNEKGPEGEKPVARAFIFGIYLAGAVLTASLYLNWVARERWIGVKSGRKDGAKEKELEAAGK